MSGLNNPELIRKLADLDSWLITTSVGENASLAGAREALWRELMTSGMGCNSYNKVKSVQMPIGLKNTRRGAFTAGKIDNLPGYIPPSPLRPKNTSLMLWRQI
jgi:hypothetical protein